MSFQHWLTQDNMAKNEVTGWDPEELERERSSYEQGSHKRDFEDMRCLRHIRKQPPDYDGPPRFCGLFAIKGKGRCRYHRTDQLDKLGNMKHGMHALRKHVAQTFDDKDQALYDWVMDTFPDAYGIDFDTDPSARYELHALAVEMVRAERGEGFILEEGEKYEQERVTDEGAVVRDEDGNVKVEESEHYLAGMLGRQRKLILKMEKALGIDRASRIDQDNTEQALDVLEGFQELGEAVFSDDKQYDPDEWGPEDGN